MTLPLSFSLRLMACLVVGRRRCPCCVQPHQLSNLGAYWDDVAVPMHDCLWQSTQHVVSTLRREERRTSCHVAETYHVRNTGIGAGMGICLGLAVGLGRRVVQLKDAAIGMTLVELMGHHARHHLLHEERCLLAAKRAERAPVEHEAVGEDRHWDGRSFAIRECVHPASAATIKLLTTTTTTIRVPFLGASPADLGTQGAIEALQLGKHHCWTCAG